MIYIIEREWDEVNFGKKQIITDNLCEIENYFEFYLDLSDIIDTSFPPEEATEIRKNFDLQIIVGSICANRNTLVN